MDTGEGGRLVVGASKSRLFVKWLSFVFRMDGDEISETINNVNNNGIHSPLPEDDDNMEIPTEKRGVVRSRSNSGSENDPSSSIPEWLLSKKNKK